MKSDRFSMAVGALALATLIGVVVAECPNACSGHGECGAHDECFCYQNYQANDCSERTCYFGLAHVDAPKGDLNHDGVISGPLTTVLTGSEVYPWGTTEQYPNADANEGHFYMECSNKGLCALPRHVLVVRLQVAPALVMHSARGLRLLSPALLRVYSRW